jgi:hypothetical protein
MKTEKITQFTNATMDLLREKVEAALAVVCEKYNITFDLGCIAFRDNTAKATLKFAAKAADGSIIDQARADWKKYAESHFFLKPEWLDQTFTDQGETYKIVGLLLQAKKFCIKCVRLRDDATITCTTRLVREKLNPTAPKSYGKPPEPQSQAQAKPAA